VANHVLFEDPLAQQLLIQFPVFRRLCCTPLWYCPAGWPARQCQSRLQAGAYTAGIAAPVGKAPQRYFFVGRITITLSFAIFILTVQFKMNALLALSRGIDRCNLAIGRFSSWLILLVVLISAGNAVVRKAFDHSSNAWLEIQWYLFSAVFLLGAGYTLLRNEHIRIDIVSSRLSPKARAWIDIIGCLLFLAPMVGIMLYYGWPIFVESWQSQEYSSDPGGLIRWPVFALIPLGFGLLALQGLSELIKRVALLCGLPVELAAETPEPR
jgi:TRAP-type mannitol/chloroaromatic compound transport system permease small subunit